MNTFVTVHWNMDARAAQIAGNKEWREKYKNDTGSCDRFIANPPQLVARSIDSFFSLQSTSSTVVSTQHRPPVDGAQHDEKVTQPPSVSSPPTATTEHKQQSVPAAVRSFLIHLGVDTDSLLSYDVFAQPQFIDSLFGVAAKYESFAPGLSDALKLLEERALRKHDKESTYLSQWRKLKTEIDSLGACLTTMCTTVVPRLAITSLNLTSLATKVVFARLHIK
jgi:hypothetical protein